MLVRSSRLSCLLVVAALVPACGSVQQLPEDFVTTEHQETRTQLMIDQAERALNAGDVGMASARIQEIAAGLSSNAHGQLVMARTLIAKGQFLEAGEMLTLLASLGSEKYAPRDYVLAKSDHTSAQRVEALKNTCPDLQPRPGMQSETTTGSPSAESATAFLGGPTVPLLAYGRWK